MRPIPLFALGLALAATPALRGQSPAPLTLGDAVRLAASRAAPAEVARLRAEQADARVTQRRAELLPQVTGAVTQADRTFNTATLGLQFVLPGANRPVFDPRGQVEGPVPTADLRARVQQTLLDLGAVRRLGAARAGATVADDEATLQGLAAGAAAAVAYVRTLRAEAGLEARAADSTLAAELLRMAREQLAAGVGVALDVTRAEAQVAAVRAQVVAARAEAARARLDLARALGLPPGTPVVLADALEARIEERPDDEATALARALATRVELRLVEDQATAARRQLGALKAERLPTLGVVADQGVIGRDYGRLLPTFTWGVQLSIPAFDGFRREGRIAEQATAVREAAVRARDMREAVETEVRLARLELAAARAQVEAGRERLRLAEQEVAQARERFAGGIAGNADVVTAALSLTAARTALVDGLAQLRLARVAVARAEGGLAALP